MKHIFGIDLVLRWLRCFLCILLIIQSMSACGGGGHEDAISPDELKLWREALGSNNIDVESTDLAKLCLLFTRGQFSGAASLATSNSVLKARKEIADAAISMCHFLLNEYGKAAHLKPYSLWKSPPVQSWCSALRKAAPDSPWTHFATAIEAEVARDSKKAIENYALAVSGAPENTLLRNCLLVAKLSATDYSFNNGFKGTISGEMIPFPGLWGKNLMPIEGKTEISGSVTCTFPTGSSLLDAHRKEDLAKLHTELKELKLGASIAGWEYLYAKAPGKDIAGWGFRINEGTILINAFRYEIRKDNDPDYDRYLGPIEIKPFDYLRRHLKISVDADPASFCVIPMRILDEDGMGAKPQPADGSGSIWVVDKRASSPETGIPTPLWSIIDSKGIKASVRMYYADPDGPDAGIISNQRGEKYGLNSKALRFSIEKGEIWGGLP